MRDSPASLEPAPAMAAGSSADRVKAIGLMVAAISLFSCLDTAAKYLAGHTGLPVSEIVWVRFLGQFALMTAIIGPAHLTALFATRKLKLQLFRSLLMVLTTACNFLALEHLRLDQTVTVAFLAPLIVALLAGPTLGEWIGWRRFVAILVGFAGILIVVRPGFSAFHPAMLYAFGSVAAYSVFMLLTRYLAAHDQPLTTLLYSILLGTVAAAPIAIADWTWPASPLEWGLLSVLGALGGFGHYLFIHAYRLAPASIVAPFLYLQLLTMVSLGWIVFGDVPDVWTMAGSGVIVASGIYLLHRERVTRGET